MKVIIVDDEKLIREGLKIVLSSYEDISICATCADGNEAYEYCRDHMVDLVLMDVRMPLCDGVLGTKLITSLKKDIRVLILTTFKDSEYLREAMKNGASGYLLKDSSHDLIYGGMKAAYEGNLVVHPDMLHFISIKNSELTIAQSDLVAQKQLTNREVDIIIEIANGLTNKEIGDKLFLTEGTIKNNITNILSKLEIRDRTQIAIFAFKNNMVRY